MAENNLLPEQELSERGLKFGYWYVTHKLQLKRALSFFLFVAGAGLLLFAIGLTAKIFVLDEERNRAVEQSLGRPLIDPSAWKARQPTPLVVKPVQVLAAEGGADLVVSITNPNDRLLALWNGRFVGVQATTTPKEEFLLPGETKYFTDLGIEAPPAALRAVRYEMGDFQWKRVDPHSIADYPSHQATRLRFEIDNIAFAATESLSRGKTVSRVSFRVRNASAYGYWGVRFLVLLHRGTQLAAVNTVELQQLESGEVRDVEVVWVQDLAAISKVEVIPSVNILDESVFMPPREN